MEKNLEQAGGPASTGLMIKAFGALGERSDYDDFFG